MSGMPTAPPPPGPQNQQHQYGNQNQQQYQTGPSAVLRSPVGLSKAVSVLLALVVVTDVLALWADFRSIDVVNRLAAPGSGVVTDREINSVDTWYVLAGIAQTVALVATAVVFLVWFYRVRVNAEVFAPEHHEKQRGWTIGAWFCPVVNLWFPRRIALDIWNASSDGGRRGAALLNWWWTAWVITVLVGWTANRQYARAETTDEIQNALGSVLATDALDIVAAVLAILFVRRLTRMQHEKAQQGSPSTPPFVPDLPAV